MSEVLPYEAPSKPSQLAVSTHSPTHLHDIRTPRPSRIKRGRKGTTCARAFDECRTNIFRWCYCLRCYHKPPWLWCTATELTPSSVSSLVPSGTISRALKTLASHVPVVRTAAFHSRPGSDSANNADNELQKMNGEARLVTFVCIDFVFNATQALPWYEVAVALTSDKGCASRRRTHLTFSTMWS